MFIPFLAMGATLDYIYIIPHFCGFVKRFAKNFFNFFQKAYRKFFTLGLSLLLAPLDIIIIPYSHSFVNSFCQIYFLDFRRITSKWYVVGARALCMPSHRVRVIQICCIPRTILPKFGECPFRQKPNHWDCVLSTLCGLFHYHQRVFHL